MERFTKFFTSLGGVLASLAAVIGGAAALYVAFGGGGDQPPNGPNPPTPVVTTSDATIEDWRTQAEDVCRDFGRGITRIGPPSGDPAVQELWLGEAIPIFVSKASGMRALEEPDAIADDVGRLLDSLDEQVELFTTMRDALARGDIATADNARLEYTTVATDTNRLAADLGLQGCV